MRARPPAPFIPPGFAPRCPVHSPPPDLFRVLVCEAHLGTPACRRAWVAHTPTQLTAAGRERVEHEALCSTGFYSAAGI